MLHIKTSKHTKMTTKTFVRFRNKQVTFMENDDAFFEGLIVSN